MKIDQDGYELHVLVCTNDKKNGCGPKGGQEIVDQLKEWTKSGIFEKGTVRVNKSGCLGRCDEGIACVAYPKGEWVVEAMPNDVQAIEEWISSLMNEHKKG
jgi:(2Fe-2S) ferredoxin